MAMWLPYSGMCPVNGLKDLMHWFHYKKQIQLHETK